MKEIYEIENVDSEDNNDYLDIVMEDLSRTILADFHF